ncbi:MAG: hypothetical protein ACN0LA_01980 [Candidatus Longimicrobiales bacterium M2_2A_002]
MKQAFVLILLALIGAGLLAWRQGVVEENQRVDAVETSKIRAWARSNTSAGVSVLPKRVPAADEDELADLEDVPGFHEYAMRCSSCHVLPDPAAYPAKRWIGKVAEMREHIQRAGVIPPDRAELEAATGFLGAVSDSLRSR